MKKKATIQSIRYTPSSKTKVIRIRVSPLLLANLRGLAHRKNKSVSQIVRVFIDQGVRREKCML